MTGVAGVNSTRVTKMLVPGSIKLRALATTAEAVTPNRGRVSVAAPTTDLGVKSSAGRLRCQMRSFQRTDRNECPPNGLAYTTDVR